MSGECGDEVCSDCCRSDFLGSRLVANEWLPHLECPEPLRKTLEEFFRSKQGR